MRYEESASRRMPLAPAAALLARCGMTEAETRAFLVAAIADRQVKLYGPLSPDGLAREPEATDWQASKVRDYAVAPISFLRGGRTEGAPARKVMRAATVDRAGVEALVADVEARRKRIEEDVSPAPQRGRKSHGETRSKNIREEIARALKAGEISAESGKRSAGARVIQKDFDTYTVDYISRLIADEDKKPATK